VDKNLDRNYLKNVKKFSKSYVTSKDGTTYEVPGTVEDLEWNHMDHAHRPHIHKTYERDLRLYYTKYSATSLTFWKKFPIILHVNDFYVEKGLFSQTINILGIVFVETKVNLKYLAKYKTKMHVDWLITSHWIFKPIHKLLFKTLIKLNNKLQEEDFVIRNQRANIRKIGYEIIDSQPDYLNSNKMNFNIIYPKLKKPFVKSLADFPYDKNIKVYAENILFIIKKISVNELLIWPGVCPHQGSSLEDCVSEGDKKVCPWHGLKIPAIKLENNQKAYIKYGFIFKLNKESIEITNA
tara:strand:- start:9844 stop:10728 length:885 start_codon:yes stop_codon:yes gene_type:complete